MPCGGADEFFQLVQMLFDSKRRGFPDLRVRLGDLDRRLQRFRVVERDFARDLLQHVLREEAGMRVELGHQLGRVQRRVEAAHQLGRVQRRVEAAHQLGRVQRRVEAAHQLGRVQRWPLRQTRPDAGIQHGGLHQARPRAGVD
ncbi:hypothetical protein H924_02310 [Corynebacterium callunae DSM 20147]|uniref:Uncharacterized protein n=1 Tax=Corynebacterium callunae DSM 20147 TaxID=1121353 RepID=M1TNM9_9CORY|nr:hypothetical protein H924_02310 [Corynebacterium callunae DSM 20147]